MKPSQKTRSLRRRTLRLPSGKPTIHFTPRASGTPTCSHCGRELHGVISSKGGSKASTLRVPSRPFGGVLCHACLTSEIRRLTRAADSDA